MRNPLWRVATVLVLVAVFVLVVPVVQAGLFTGTPSLECDGIHFSPDSLLTLDRDNTGAGREYAYLRGYDGAGTQILFVEDTRPVGSDIGFAPVYPWDVAPAYNPLTVRLVSPAYEGLPEQILFNVVGECEGLPWAEPEPEPVLLPGCDVLLPIPATAVGGTFVADAPVYWTPGELTSPLVTIPAGNSARVIGLDASGQYYKIIWVCDFVWVPVGTLGPNYDAVWNGAPLPTGVVE